MRGNTEQRWGSVQIALHWTIAALVLLVQVPAGITMASVDPGTVQNVGYNIHKTTGIVIFLLALVRLGWRWTHPVPALPADMPKWQARLARTTHALLYVVLFAMPISGFLYTAMGGFPVPFFMVYDLARFVPVNKPVAEVFKYAHLTLQFVLYVTVLLHVAGALYHHQVRRDPVLLRMLSSARPLPALQQGALDKRPGPDRIADWTEEKVVQWLRGIGLQKYQGTFRANRITGELLLELNEKQLETLLMKNPIHRLQFNLALSKERERMEGTGYMIDGSKNIDKALSFLKDWTTALIGFQIALIGAIGVFNIKFRDQTLIAFVERFFLYLCLLAFVISIVIGSGLLNMLPGASQRQPANRLTKNNDIYTIKIGNAKIYHLTVYFRLSFLIGIVLFGIFVAVRFLPDSNICYLDEWLPDILGTCPLTVEWPDSKDSLGLVQVHRIDPMDTKAWW